MNHDQLKVKAKELGIKDAESLTYNQLQKAVKAAEEAKEKSDKLHVRAKELGLDTEGVSDQDLEAAVAEEEAEIAKSAAAAKAAELLQEKIEVLKDHLDLPGFDDLSAEDLKKAISERDANLVGAAIAEKTTVVLDNDKKASEGKSDAVFKSQKGKEYSFTEDAPASFRYMGQIKTQKEWMADKDAMEIMVSGNLSYLTLKK